MWKKGVEDQDERDRILEMTMRSKSKRVKAAKKGGDSKDG